jgi:hypothetical protein
MNVFKKYEIVLFCLLGRYFLPTLGKFLSTLIEVYLKKIQNDQLASINNEFGSLLFLRNFFKIKLRLNLIF